MENSVGVSLKGNRETCPRCGYMAEILDGEFDFIGNTTVVRNAPKATLDLLSALQRALLAAQEGKSKDQIVGDLEKISPEAAAAASTVYSKGGLALLVVFLLMLLNQCTANIDIKLDINRLVDQWMHHADSPKSPAGPGDPQPTAKPPTKETHEALSRQQRRKLERQAAKRQKQTSRTARTR